MDSRSSCTGPDGHMDRGILQALSCPLNVPADAHASEKCNILVKVDIIPLVLAVTRAYYT